MVTHRSLMLSMLCSWFLVAELPRFCQAQQARFPDVETDRHIRMVQAAFDHETQKARKAVELWVIVLIVGVVAVGLGFCGWLYIRSRASTDPMHHAVNDPWMREYLANLSPEERGKVLAQLAASPENVARVDVAIGNKAPTPPVVAESDPAAVRAAGPAQQAPREDAFTWPK